MRSFALTFATLFFGAVCSARPTLPVVDSVANVAGSALAAVTNVVPRGDVRGITVILTEAKGKLLPLAQQIASVTTQNGTTQNLTPVVIQLQTVVSGACVELKGLVGLPTSVIFAGINGVEATVDDIAELVVDILHILIEAIDIKCLDVNVRILVKDLLQVLCTLVATLISILISLVDGLLIHITPLLGDIVVAIHTFGISVLVKVLLL